MMLLFVLGVSVLAVVTAYSPEEWKDIIDRVNEWFSFQKSDFIIESDFFCAISHDFTIFFVFLPY